MSRSPEAPSPSRVGQLVLGRFRVEAFLGAGALGVVYRGLDEQTGELVAMKFLREEVCRIPTATARFLREARIAQQLQHPAIPRGFALGAEHGVPVLVMEYLSGKTLTRLLEEHGPLAVSDALRVGAHIAEALDCAHRRSIVHRDIKPDNLMLLDGGAIPSGICVLDFSVAFCLDEPRLSRVGAVVGSPEYLSPEQVRGIPVSASADLYGLGATLFTLLTGAPPFRGKSSAELLLAHVTAKVPSLRERRAEIPPDVETYVHRLLAKTPAERPASAREVARSLTELADRAERKVNELHTRAIVAPPPDPSLQQTPEELTEELEACVQEFHQVSERAATAQARLINLLTERIGKRLEREEAQRQGIIVPYVDELLERQREQALEGQIARLNENARAEEEALLERMSKLREAIEQAREL